MASSYLSAANASQSSDGAAKELHHSSFTALPFTSAECFALQNHASLTWGKKSGTDSHFWDGSSKKLGPCVDHGDPMFGRPNNASVRPNVQERANATRLHTTCMLVANTPQNTETQGKRCDKSWHLHREKLQVRYDLLSMSFVLTMYIYCSCFANDLSLHYK